MNNGEHSSEKRPSSVEIPHDIVNEQILVAAVLRDPEVRETLIPKVPPSLFVDSVHNAVWSALRTMYEQKVKFDLAVLYQKCSDKVELQYLKYLLSQYPDEVPNIDYHVGILRWDSIRASAVRGPITDLLKTLRDPKAPKERVRGIAKQVASAFDKIIDRNFMLDPVLLAKDHLMRMQDRKVWPYGIEGLDKDEKGRYRMIPGAEPGKTTILTGVSGSAKSTVAAMIALEQARMGKRVLYGAWEMEPGPTLELLALISLGYSRYDVSTGNLTSYQLEEFGEKMKVIGTKIRFFNPPFSGEFNRRYNNDDSLNELNRQVADSGADVTVLDLWERMIPDGSPDAERRALFRTQHLFAINNCHGILLSQQRLKQIEERNDKRPTRSTILGSQAWVDIGDTILGLHRPGQWEPRKGDDILQIIVLKQRFGRWPLAVEGDWNGDRGTIKNCRTIEYEAAGENGELADRMLDLGNGKKRR